MDQQTNSTANDLVLLSDSLGKQFEAVQALGASLKDLLDVLAKEKSKLEEKRIGKDGQLRLNGDERMWSL